MVHTIPITDGPIRPVLVFLGLCSLPLYTTSGTTQLASYVI